MFRFLLLFLLFSSILLSLGCNKKKMAHHHKAPQFKSVDSAMHFLNDKVGDPWFVTHPKAKNRLKNDVKALNSLTKIWENSESLSKAKKIQKQINQAIGNGQINSTSSFYNCSPWAPIFTADKDITIGKKDILQGESFTLKLCFCKGVQRGILVGKFVNAQKLCYCHPNSGHHH